MRMYQLRFLIIRLEG
ncbi:hypothetical protein MTR67_001414 [Solanum verrucosum]|uniref:Uncharacterized protein n=1 Tax=Solanum verrucosum TaxID=315347 RepID=A0AAF0PU79_SOLVR|nr:hypothetical protein MTR67_001414 [Solanum verrucosum]